MSQDKTIKITFKNAKSEQTHTFQRENIIDYGFFKGLLTNPLKENQTGQAVIHFSTGQDEVIAHPVHFKFMKDLFQNLEKIFQQGNLSNLPLNGEFLYQVDKLLEYFMCSQFKDEILNEARKIFHCDKPTTCNIVYATLILYDHLGFAIAMEELRNYYRCIESIEDYIVFYNTLHEIVLEHDFYQSLQKIDMYKLLNQVRGYITPEFLGSPYLSKMLLIQPEDWLCYFYYHKSTHSLYFQETDLPTYGEDQDIMVTKDESLLRMTLMTQGVMKNMNWDNVILAGGAVNIMLDATLQPTDFPGSDIDIFIYGQTSDIRQNKVNQLLQYFADQVYPNRRHFYAMRGSVISIYIDECPTVFQIISGNSKTILDVLHYFDLDHLRVAYQNGEFYMTMEAAEAFRTKTSYVRGYGTKPLRIWKAVSRGYNLVDNGSLVLDCNCANLIDIPKYGLNDNRDDILSQKQQERLQKITWQQLHNKFKSLKYKYYYPHMGESDAKVTYEINLHTGISEDNVTKDILKIKKGLILDGDFKNNFNTGYLGKFIDIDPKRLKFTYYDEQYFALFYDQINQFGRKNKMIGFRTPLIMMNYITSSNQPFDDFKLRYVVDCTIYTDVNFLKYVEMISRKIFKELQQYVKQNQKISFDKLKYLSRIIFKYRILRVKMKPEKTQIYLKNKKQLSLMEVNFFIKNFKEMETETSKCRFYADLYIDKFWLIDRGDCTGVTGVFIYMVKNLYLLDEIDEKIYSDLKLTKIDTITTSLVLDESSLEY